MLECIFIGFFDPLMGPVGTAKYRNLSFPIESVQCLDDFWAALDRADAEHVDIHLGNHVDGNKMFEKLEKQEKEGGNPFINEKCWHDFISRTRGYFCAMIEKEKV